MKLVSVIIPAFNAEKTIGETIGSALDQRSSYSEMEVIVVNDGSTDNTGLVLDKFKTECKIVHTENSGVSAARTKGLEHANGDFIQYLDSDDLLIPGKISEQVRALESKNGDVAYGDWEMFTEHNGIIKVTKSINRRIEGDPVMDIFIDFWCPPAALLYSKAITQRLTWSMHLPVIQDSRYLLDAALLNAKFIYTPGVQARYRTGQEGSLSKRNSRAFIEDMFVNTRQLYEQWSKDPDFGGVKKSCVLKSLRHCIAELNTFQSPLANKALDLLLAISPQYIPEERGLHRRLSQLIGFRRAEKIAVLKRKLFK